MDVGIIDLVSRGNEAHAVYVDLYRGLVFLPVFGISFSSHPQKARFSFTLCTKPLELEALSPLVVTSCTRVGYGTCDYL